MLQRTSRLIDQPTTRKPERILVALGCLLVIVVGAYLRLAGTNWDEGANLHPDERHMMFVVSDTQRGLDALKPGELPHLAVVIAAQLSGTAGWPQVLLLARSMGAILDSYTILAVFLLASAVSRNGVASIVAAALYAFSPMAIQQSNFFMVDAWLTSAGAWCLVASTMLLRADSKRQAAIWALLSGASAGLALACKIPGLAFTGVFVVSAVAGALLSRGKIGKGGLLLVLVVGLLADFATLRLASPFTFQGPGVFGLAPTQAYIDGFVTMSGLVLDIGFPPAWQWIAGYSVLHALVDVAIWGLGPPASLALVTGTALLLLKRPAYWPSFIPAAVSVVAFFTYYLVGPVSALRYVLPAFPGLCVIAAAPFALAARSRRTVVASLVLVVAAGIWGHGMFTLHTSTNSRVAASRWLWATTAKGTAVANESRWDDGLPVPVILPGQQEHTGSGHDGHFTFLSLDMEYPDTPAKAHHLAATLDQADLVVMSSERMRRPILNLADRFPLSAAYYRLLSSGALCFERAYRDQRGYPVLGRKVNDQSAQETWSVYDHPTVEIYRKIACFDAKRVEAQLMESVPRTDQKKDSNGG
jgi:hypothetical protein